MWLPTLPSSTTAFPAAVEASQERCKLGQLNLIRFPYLGISPYIVNIAFPYWIEQIDLEVWQYGENVDGAFEPPYTDLHDLNKQLAFLVQRDVPTQYDVDIDDQTRT